jgi:hypothetical protein
MPGNTRGAGASLLLCYLAVVAKSDKIIAVK